MSAEDFIDTNVFIYALEDLDPRKATIANQLIRTSIANGSGCISYQVIQETLSTILRKAEIPLTVEGAREYLEVALKPLLRVSASIALYHRALDIQDRYRYSFYDSLIIAAALQAGCKRLYSEDLHDGQRIENLLIVNPFED